MGSWFQREEKKPKKPRKKTAFHSFLLKILTRKINSRFLNGIKEQDKLWNLRKYMLSWWELNKIRGYYQSYVCTLIIKLMLFHFNKCWIWLWWLLSVLVAINRCKHPKLNDKYSCPLPATTMLQCSIVLGKTELQQPSGHLFGPRTWLKTLTVGFWWVMILPHTCTQTHAMKCWAKKSCNCWQKLWRSVSSFSSSNWNSMKYALIDIFKAAGIVKISIQRRTEWWISEFGKTTTKPGRAESRADVILYYGEFSALIC